jgi:hypothetical protein
MKTSALIKLGLVAMTACIILTTLTFLRPSKQNTQNTYIDITRNKRPERSNHSKTESIFEKKIRSTNLDLKDLRGKMSFIKDMIGDDTYPADSMAARAKLAVDLEFFLSLEPSYEQLSCIDKISTNYTRDSMISATNPEDYLARMSMFGETIREFGDKIDYEQLMQTIVGQTTEALLLLRPDVSQQYKEVMSSSLSPENEQGEVASRILGGIVAHELGKEPSSAIGNLRDIKEPLLRLGTEKALLRDGSIDNVTKQNFGAYYLSNDCQLPHDIATEKNLFGLGIKYDPEAISSIINNAPSGPKKDFAIEHLVFRTAVDDPERSKLWLELIEDPNIKNRARKFFHEKK